MSPILKREVSETIRQARRLAAAAGFANYDDDSAEYELARVGSSTSVQSAGWRSGVGVGGPGPGTGTGMGGGVGSLGRERERERGEREPGDRERGERERGDREVVPKRLSTDSDRDGVHDSLLGHTYDTQDGNAKAIHSKWGDLWALLLTSTPSLLFGLVGNVFSGELLEHCARWRVFRRVDELFILVPMVGNLKGNLEMCLCARLGTSAMLGELDSRKTRKRLLSANMTLLGLQALLISALAGLISFALGLLTTHRLGDVPANGAAPAGGVPPGAVGGARPSNLTHGSSGTVSDPTLNDQWNEGYTRPGIAQLLMVLATGMGAAGLTSCVLGSFMSFLVVLCRWTGVDPDNITPPIAACLGDLCTIFILGLLGTALVGTMDTPVPLVAVAFMGVAAVWFSRRVLRDEWVRNVAKGSWAPLIAAMLISSGTGTVLATGVARYRDFALLAVSMSGLTGAIGAIHANRLSTTLHMGLHPDSAGAQARNPEKQLSPAQTIAALWIVSLPCLAVFLAFVHGAKWIDIDLGWCLWISYLAAVTFSLVAAHYLTLWCWKWDLDPDSYTLPVHSAIVDFVGQTFLMGAYELARAMGNSSVMAGS